ncbi:hypothetical protein J1N35_038261 [Gossypium stocksii]|uniref:Uncharacterized protein n=1 Tax=Gossypium stocksii TaxID=47602 RepID=A0A9D3ZMJ2_9ROSI|nr:hypothetical protein J1N35_038261 [Gossypium stocksii]
MTLTDNADKCHTLFTAWSVWLHRNLFVWKGVANSHQDRREAQMVFDKVQTQPVVRSANEDRLFNFYPSSVRNDLPMEWLINLLVWPFPLKVVNHEMLHPAFFALFWAAIHKDTFGIVPIDNVDKFVLKVKTSSSSIVNDLITNITKPVTNPFVVENPVTKIVGFAEAGENEVVVRRGTIGPSTGLGTIPTRIGHKKT